MSATTPPSDPTGSARDPEITAARTTEAEAGEERARPTPLTPERGAGERGDAQTAVGHLRQIDKLMTQSKGRFHDEVPSGYPTLPEEEALERLRAGRPVEHAYIDRLTLTGEFPKGVLLRDVYIKSLALTEVRFSQSITLQACHVHRLFAEDCVVQESFVLKRTELTISYMRCCELLKGLNCESLKVRSKFLMSKCVVKGRLRFWEALFDDWVQFEDCTFEERFDFRSAECAAGLSALRSRFLGPALFRGAHVALKLELNGSRFEDLVDLSKAKLHDFVYLDDIEQGERQRWAFWNTVSERILVRPEQVEGRLLSEEQGDYAKAMREYGVLKRSYEHEHLYSYDDWAFYRFKVNERRARGASWSRPWTKLVEIFDWILLDWGCGYGTDPLKAVRAALVMVLFFAVIYTLGFHKVYPIEQPPFSYLPKDALLNQFGVSLFLSVAAFTSGFGDLRESVMDWMNVPLMIEALLGTLLWGLFIVAFGRKVVR